MVWEERDHLEAVFFSMSGHGLFFKGHVEDFFRCSVPGLFFSTWLFLVEKSDFFLNLAFFSDKSIRFSETSWQAGGPATFHGFFEKGKFTKFMPESGKFSRCARSRGFMVLSIIVT